MVASTASSVFAEYCFEANNGFGAGGSLNKPIQFGKEVKISGLEFKNNQMALGQLYSPEIETFAYGKSEGKCSAEYVLSNPWFFKSVLGTPVPTNAAGLYTYTWSSTPTSSNYMRNIHSMALRLGFDIESDYKRTALGVVCPSINLKMALNETVKVSQELIWGSETVNQTMGASQGVEMTGGSTPYTFVHAAITSPLTGSTLATVQSFDLNINSNAELIYQMAGKISLVLKNSAFLESVYGRAGTSNDLVVTISNGGSGTALRSIVMTFTGCSFSGHSTNGVEPGELLLEDVDFQCKHVSRKLYIDIIL